MGDEGGFAPPCQSFEDALDLLTGAIEKAGYKGLVKVWIQGVNLEDCFFPWGV